MFERDDDQVYLSETEHVNETMGFPIMVNVIHQLGFVRWNYTELVKMISDEKESTQPASRR